MTEKKYTNGEINIIWKAGKCIHSGNCVRGLPLVFRPKEKPWIRTEMAGTEELIEQVNKCPSGALSYELIIQKNEHMENQKSSETKITVADKGPYLVRGKFIFVDKDGKEEMKEGNIALCRCGLSKNKPFCDGTHKTSDVLNY
ncbi:MAG: hypothetical protein DWQ44_04700 [Bacteroidetes bacterium]|nr:MAG: hypothetical protein DWQ33_11090 [Bacteroidota bacterium]REK00632.1 MAG: hypothetical protein DWQ39_10765 [Bacteroidota bacterium]REK35246.1 MAG: hypothetical protein DWQ44_04700 [Bacteroidota bacterium]REK48323.1 MAG: hypothetical protein DWQ48_10900 [Bacteroidota bacterium]